MAVMLEGARIYFTSHHLQNCADAAALAGARYVSVYSDPNWSDDPASNARDIAAYYALQNATLGGRITLYKNDDPENALDQDIVIGRYLSQSQVFNPTMDTPNAMKVVARLDDDLNPSLAMRLGKIFGGQPKSLSRYAIAMVKETAGAGLVALAPDGVGLKINGTPYINVDGGSIYVHSSDPEEAIKFIGTPDISAEDINVVGNAYSTGGFDVETDIVYNSPEGSSLNEGVQAKDEPDPYYGLDEPTYAGMTDLSPKDPNTGEPMLLKITGGTHTLQAGYYSRGVEILGGDVTLETGMYHLGGDLSTNKANGGFVVKGSANVDASAGVLLHIVENGFLYIGGGGEVTINPLGTGLYENFSIFQTRETFGGEEGNDSTIIGTGDIEVNGILYFPKSLIHIQGTAEEDAKSIGEQLIGWRVEVGGNGEVKINYDKERLPADQSWLVE
jgi:hypothetical protein